MGYYLNKEGIWVRFNDEDGTNFKKIKKVAKAHGMTDKNAKKMHKILTKDKNFDARSKAYWIERKNEIAQGLRRWNSRP